MSLRKGEITKAGIDRQWPHQVALRAPLGERYPEMIAFCRERAAAPRHPGFWRDDADWISFAFSEPADAESFDIVLAECLSAPKIVPDGHASAQARSEHAAQRTRNWSSDRVLFRCISADLVEDLATD